MDNDTVIWIALLFVGCIFSSFLGMKLGHEAGMEALHNGVYECVTALEQVVCKDLR